MSDIALTLETAEALWRSALQHELGVKVPISQKDIEKVRKLMYEARKGHPELEELRLITAPGGTEVWIMRKTTELP